MYTTEVSCKVSLGEAEIRAIKMGFIYTIEASAEHCVSLGGEWQEMTEEEFLKRILRKDRLEFELLKNFGGLIGENNSAENLIYNINKIYKEWHKSHEAK